MVFSAREHELDKNLTWKRCVEDKNNFWNRKWAKYFELGRLEKKVLFTYNCERNSKSNFKATYAICKSDRIFKKNNIFKKLYWQAETM